MPTSSIPEYPNLSGMQMIFENGVLTPMTQGLVTDLTNRSVLIIGTAVDGPIATPVDVSSIGMERVFGGFVRPDGQLNGATLSFAGETLANAGVERIIGVRIGGAAASMELGAQTVIERVNEIHEQYLGVMQGYSVDLGQRFVDFESIEITATHNTIGIQRIIQRDRYRLIPQGSTTGNDLLVINGPAFSDSEDIIIRFQYNNLVGSDPNSTSVSVTENDLSFTVDSVNITVTTANTIQSLSEVKMGSGEIIPLEDISVTGRGLQIPIIKLPQDVNNNPNAPIIDKPVSLPVIAKSAGRIIVIIEAASGVPFGVATVTHHSTYLTAGAEIGKFPIEFDDNNSFYFIDLTDVAESANLGSAVTVDEETIVSVRYNTIPFITVTYLTNSPKVEKDVPLVRLANGTLKATLSEVPFIIDEILTSGEKDPIEVKSITIYGRDTLSIASTFVPFSYTAALVPKMVSEKGVVIPVDSIDIYGKDIIFTRPENIPLTTNNQPGIALDKTTYPGRVIVKLVCTTGTPDGRARLFHDKGYATADVVIGSFDIQYSGAAGQPGGFHYVDITDAADALGDETTVRVRFNSIPNLDIGYFTTNGVKDGEVAPVLTIGDRTQVYTLEYAPIPGRLTLYANKNQILNTGAFRIINQNQIQVHRAFINEGADVEVRFEHERISNVTPMIGLTTIGAGYLYNETMAEVRNVFDIVGNIIAKELIITKPESKREQNEASRFIFSSINFPTLGQMVNAINGALGQFLRAQTNRETVYSVSLLASAQTNFSGGEDGITNNRQELFKLFAGERDADGILITRGIFHELEAIRADFVVPLGVFADDMLPGRFDNFAYELCMFCATASTNNVMTHGIIEMRDARDMTYQGLNNYVDHVLNFENEWFIRMANGAIWKNDRNQPQDVGKFITIIAGPNPIVMSPTAGLIRGSKSVMLAAMQATMPYRESGTRWRLPSNVSSLNFSFNLPQVNRILSSRITTFGVDEDGFMIVWDGPTSAAPGSEYNRLSVMKTIRENVAAIRRVAKPFLGRSISTEDQTAITSMINDELKDIEQESYDFEILFKSTARHFRDAQVQLAIKTYDELRRVTTVISLL